MKLDEIFDAICGTSRDDWLKIDDSPVDHWVSIVHRDRREDYPCCHHQVAVLKADVRITIASGAPEDATVRESWSEPWTKAFYDGAVYMHRASIRFNGVPVYRLLVASMDSGLVQMAVPEAEFVDAEPQYYFSHERRVAAEVIYELGGETRRTFREACEAAGIEIRP